MKTTSSARAGWVLLIATSVAACGSEQVPQGGNGGTTSLSGTGGGAGTGVTAGSAGTPAAGGGQSGSGGGSTAGAAGTALGGAAGMAGAGTAGVAVGGSAGASGGAAGTGNTGTANFTINVQLASEVDSKAPSTVGIVTWSVDAPGITSARIDFGLDTSYGMTAPVDLNAMSYRTLLLGMKPEQTYHFRVAASDGTTEFQSADQTVMTGMGTSANLITGVTAMNAAAVTKGFFVASFWRSGTTNTPFIFDTDGEIVWWYTASASGISRARMSADGQSIWLVRETLQGAPLERVSIDGLSTQTYMNTVASHDITAVSGDTMAYLDYGESDCDSIFEIDNAGTTREVFESTNVTGTPGSLASCHSNAVRYSQTEDVYTFSDHRQDVAVVSRTGELVWKLTQRVTGGNSAWGGSQHGHQLLANSLLIYANDGGGSGDSTAIEYGLDGSLIKEFTSRGSATNFGDVQRLSNGQTVITYSTSNLVQVVDANDAVVFEARGAGAFGYLEFRESLYGLPLDIQQ